MKKLIAVELILFLVLLSVSCHDERLLPAPPDKDSSTTVLLKASVKISVGGVMYDNLDAQLRVRGFDANEVMRWEKDYEFTGPVNTLSVQNGFHHYSVELLDKWGVHDIRTNISAADLWNGRADGPLPVTYGLGGSKPAKRLTMYITSREADGPDGSIAVPETKVIYTYSADGRVESIQRLYFDSQTKVFIEGEIQNFTYAGGQVSKIVVTRNGKTAIEYKYEYGLVNTITETNVDAGIVTTQTTDGNDGSRPVVVNFSFSNGNSLSCQFGYSFNNIVNDITINSGQLCNAGNYTYDKYINPFRQLGYLDYNFQNWSVNNKTIEDVDFIACSFPTLIPLYHSYTYDLDGYPVRKVTTYKSGSGQNKSYHGKVNYFYE